jgi:hypothetical protein
MANKFGSWNKTGLVSEESTEGLIFRAFAAPFSPTFSREMAKTMLFDSV